MSFFIISYSVHPVLFLLEFWYSNASFKK